MRIGIYNRNWNTRGGGEKHVGAVAEALSIDHEVELIGTEPFDLHELSGALNLRLAATRQVIWPALPCHELAPLTRQYDLFLNATYLSPLASLARRSAYLVFFPQSLMSPLHAAAWTAARACIAPLSARRARRIAIRLARESGAFLRTYSILIANSRFTSGWIRKRWKREPVMLPPPVDISLFRAAPGQKKRRIILSVGRFFRGSHNKKHPEMIHAFRAMCDRGLLPAGWELHLAGHVHRDAPAHIDYFSSVTRLAAGYPIAILPDLALPALRREYQNAAIFWHATGWGEDERRNPERCEHFGITTCEAMSAGCVPVVIAKAGQLELVEDGRNGFTFHGEEELIAKTLHCIGRYEQGDLQGLSRTAASSVRHFDRDSFGRRAREILLAPGDR